MRNCKSPLVLGGFTLSLAFGAPAFAQSNPELGDVAPAKPATGPRTEVVTTTHTTTERERRVTPTRDVAVSGTDHAFTVGRFGIGAFGVLELPTMGGTGAAGGLNLDANATLSAPSIGVRYWLDERLGIEAAIGIGWQGGSTRVEVSGPGGVTNTLNDVSLFGLALHGGLPIVFASAQHIAFLVIPELNLGFVSGSWDDQGPNNRDTDLSGFLLEVGARAGAEIEFGFIGIPQLALQGTVGLHLRYEGRSASVGNTETSRHTLTFRTSVDGEDFLTANLAAIYYF
jgi:hypothetical protein